MNGERNIMNRRGLRGLMRPWFPILLLSFLAGCASEESAQADVLATFYPLAWASAEIAGDNATVATLVPSGIEPHDWEPTATDVARLADAKLVVKQGAGFEPWLDGLLANLAERAPPVVDTTAELALVEDDEAHYDPHTWLDPVRFAAQAGAIERGLVAAFPGHAGAMAARADALEAELADLHADYDAGLASCEVRTIIANHDAYSYLASRYRFDVIALSGLSPEAEPSPEEIARAVDAAREHDISIIFFEELVSPRVAEVVATEVGAQTRVLSPAESAPAEGDYVSLMRTNLVNLQEAMRCT